MIHQGRRRANPGRPGRALAGVRRDLRDFDHATLGAALAAHEAVPCAFVFDTEIPGARTAARTGG